MDPPPELVKIILIVLAEKKNDRKKLREQKIDENWKRDQFEDGALRLSARYFT